jgi:hypothetical protein
MESRKRGKYFLVLTIPVALFTNQLGPQLSILSVVIVCAIYLAISDSFPSLERSKVLTSIGDSSYSIYLVHLPVIYLFQFSPNAASLRNFFGIEYIQVALILLLGFTINWVVERPLNFGKVAQMTQRMRVSITLVLIFVPIVSFGTGLISLKQTVQNISVTEEDYGPTWIWDTNCESYQTPRSEKSNVCSYPINTSSPSALLIGDSHAAVFV